MNYERLTTKGLNLLKLYKSPINENSVAKGIPSTQDNIDAILSLNGKAFEYQLRIKYRGPRRPGVKGQATCLKRDAKTFAVYSDNYDIYTRRHLSDYQNS